MKVTCKQTTSNGFDLRQVTTVTSNNFDYNFGGYGIELDKEYVVMGIALYKDSNCLYYLIDTFDKPYWFPFLLFKITDGSFSKSWFIRADGIIKESDIHTLWGFEELCNDDQFYDSLIERDDEALRIYFQRKIEMHSEMQ